MCLFGTVHTVKINLASQYANVTMAKKLMPGVRYATSSLQLMDTLVCTQGRLLPHY